MGIISEEAKKRCSYNVAPLCITTRCSSFETWTSADQYVTEKKETASKMWFPGCWVHVGVITKSVFKGTTGGQYSEGTERYESVIVGHRYERRVKVASAQACGRCNRR